MVNARRDSFCDNPGLVFIANFRGRITDTVGLCWKAVIFCTCLSFTNCFVQLLLMDVVDTKSAKKSLNRKFRVLYSKQMSVR